MSESTTEDLGAGYSLRVEDNDDGGSEVTLIKPDGTEELITGGYAHESPEDMLWHRELGEIFRAGLEVGKAIGKAGKEG